jgi:hypothetical protein
LFVLALGGCATLLTGNWIWAERRAALRPSLFTTLLAKLTAGVGVGCFTAVATLMLASRLLPFEAPNRIQHEEIAMAGTLVLTVAVAFVSRNTAALWWRGFGIAGALFAAVPLAAARHSAHGLFGSGPRHPAVVSVDLSLLAGGLVLIACAVLLRRYHRQLRDTRSSEPRRLPASSPADLTAAASSAWPRSGAS